MKWFLWLWFYNAYKQCPCLNNFLSEVCKTFFTEINVIVLKAKSGEILCALSHIYADPHDILLLSAPTISDCAAT